MTVGDLVSLCDNNIDIELWQNGVLIEKHDDSDSLSGTFDDEIIDHIEVDTDLIMIYL